ncbi:hypothetical protein C7S20_07580 [Christiangramia fulva]|uniref:Sodium:proline symporter n=1 Tax=Christiangramia fulva TaxID=2126553 RepID=A0A2R3Z4K2_9FLAO|nr:hypothetical protein [Christiangramia fulva]AVR45142.1 hypothetical protein C7S20_07580 [Christiangramia fulva]
MDSKFWRSAIVAGLIAGFLMLALEYILVPIFLEKPVWVPLRMMASIVLGKSVVPPPATFDFNIILSGIIIHIILSLIYSLFIAYITRKLSLVSAMLVGGFLGLALYFINFYGFSNIFIWFEKARNWVQILIHIVFGMAAAMSFISLNTKRVRDNLNRV